MSTAATTVDGDESSAEPSYAEQVMEQQGLSDAPEEPQGAETTEEVVIPPDGGEEEKVKPDTQDGDEKGDGDADKSKPKTDGEDDDPGDKGDPAAETDSEKPPAGMVPYGALHAKKEEVKFLKGEADKAQDTITELQQQLAAIKEQPELDDDLKDFEILSDEDLLELADEDPGEFAVYLRKEERYKDAQRKSADLSKQADASEESYQNLVTEGFTAIEKAFPGIYDENSEFRDNLVSAAQKTGFPDTAFSLTDPRTKIIVHGSTEPTALGTMAVEILNLISGTAGNENASDVDEKTLREQITKEVHADLLKKFKADPTKAPSLADIPTTSGDETKGEMREPTDAEILTMTSRQKQAWHAGQDWRV